jgi:DUF4097 and DUF4098 domain-containing protein YvlB
MSHPRFSLRNAATLGSLSLLSLVVPWSLVHAGRAIEERHPADSDGTVEISAVAGSVEVSGWDRPEIEVTGTANDSVERIEITGNGSRNSVRVIQRSGSSWHMSSDDTHLVVHLPAHSTVSATLVSANLKIHGVSGDATLRTVSGDVSGEVGGDLHANTVSGNVTLSAPAAHTIEVKTISGDIHLDGGAGDIEISTVSGDAKIALATVTHGRFKSISGDLATSLSLSPDAQLDGQSVSGTLHFDFPQLPAAEFDVQSLSGSIDSCFGPKPVEPRYGPGSRLVFKNGESHAHVRLETKNGDIQLCDKAAPSHASVRSPDPNLRHVDFRYVL